MYIAVRDVMLRYLKKEDPWGSLKQLGASAVELVIDRNLQTPDFLGFEGKVFHLEQVKEREALQRKTSENKVKICAFLMANNFSNKNIEEEIKWMKRACAIANKLNIETIRIDISAHLKEEEVKPFIQRCGNIIKEVLSSTEKVSLGIENHSNLTNKKEIMDAILKEVNSDRLGITLDSGNFYWWGYPLKEVYQVIEHFAPYVKHTHIKNISYPLEKREIKREIGWEYAQYVAPIYEGDIDHSRVISILKKAGYNGDITVEDESLGKFPENERGRILKKDVEYLKEIIQR